MCLRPHDRHIWSTIRSVAKLLCPIPAKRNLPQGLMAVSTLLSFLSTLLEAAEYFWSKNCLDSDANFKMILILPVPVP